MSVSSIGSNASLGLSRSILDAREALNDLQRQLGTGKRATTYGGLGTARGDVLSLRSEISQLGGYRSSISQANIRVDVLSASIARIRELAAATRAGALQSDGTTTASGQSQLQLSASGRFDEVLSLLNTEIGGRYLFGGRATETAPVLSSKEIFDGSGGKAGLRQIAAERQAADLGANGLGRLNLSPPGGSSVTVSQQNAGPFGFKLSAVSSTLTGATVSGPSGVSRSIGVAFSATAPQDGQAVRLTLALPDGATTDVTLTARSGGPTALGEFQIGANAAATAANFRAALSTALGHEAQTTLAAASTFAATDDFFDADSANPPQRVNGPPFGTASSLRDATATDTVLWYEGEAGPAPARDSAVVKTDDSAFVAYGVRADEDAFRTTLKTLAALAIDTSNPASAGAGERYQALRTRAAAALDFPAGTQSIDDITTEIGVAKAALGRADQRHQANINLLQGLVDNTENVDIYEVSSQIVALQTRLQASLQVTANLRQLSLVNYL